VRGFISFLQVLRSKEARTYRLFDHNSQIVFFRIFLDIAAIRENTKASVERCRWKLPSGMGLARFFLDGKFANYTKKWRQLRHRNSPRFTPIYSFPPWVPISYLRLD
jgi:hypothetical protein